MAKVSQVHSTLLKKQDEEQRQFELEAKKSLEESLKRLEQNSTESLRLTLKTIEKAMTQQDSKTVARLERKLTWLGWERWLLLFLAFLVGAILGPAFLYFKQGEIIEYNNGASKKVIVLRHYQAPQIPEGE